MIKKSPFPVSMKYLKVCTLILAGNMVTRIAWVLAGNMLIAWVQTSAFCFLP